MGMPRILQITSLLNIPLMKGIHGHRFQPSWEAYASLHGLHLTYKRVKARIRITQNGMSGTSAENFSLMRRPENVRVDRVCQDDNQLVLAWDPVDEAFNYDIFVLGSQYMDSIGNTTDTYLTITVSDLSEEQWLAVCANGINGMRSNRTIAIPFEGLGSGGANPAYFLVKVISMQASKPLPQVFLMETYAIKM